MMLWQLPESETKSGFWSSGKAESTIQITVVNEVLQLLNNDFTIGKSDAASHTKVLPKDIAILVRTNAQAKSYQDVLRQIGVPSVLNSTESVFASEQAQQLFLVIQAVAQPGDIRLLKQALTLDWFNLDGQQFYHMLNDELALDAWILRFQDYFQLWQSKGLMVMMQTLLQREQVQIHLSRRLDAERQLTNLHHLLELLQQAAVDEHLGVNKTLQWLRTAITSEHFDEAQQLRLESDQHAVSIVTMHRAKGLEYPVVFCPYVWQRSQRLRTESEMITCHEQGEIIADIGSEQFEDHRRLALQEELAEDIRVLYVALTRAKFRCYIAWADVRSEKQANQSAMAYLLFNSDQQEALDYLQQQTILQNFSEQSPHAFSYEQLSVTENIVDHYRVQNQQQQFSHCSFTRTFSSYWQMSSYTALSALSLDDTPELPLDKAEEQQIVSQEAELQLPKGAHTGNVVHDLLENTGFAELAQMPESRRQTFSLQRDRACLRYGLKLEHPQLLDILLQQTVCTPLSSDAAAFCLADLHAGQCLKEMPFYLSTQALDTLEINQVLQHSATFQSLTSKQIQGYLTGFIDLVCEYQGRYYVLDYKTNALADYQPQTLIHAMREHNYGLQYWLYTLVLHRYLQNRLPDYSYESHFGGVFYLFVRGMQATTPGSGVFQHRPEFKTLQALAQLFGTDS